MPKPARRVLGSIRHGDAATGTPLISLATRVPATLKRQLHAYCATSGVVHSAH